MSNHVTFDPLTVRCGVCDRRVGIVQEWYPFGEGIRHHRCWPKCRGCGEDIPVGDEVFSETLDAYCSDCADALASIEDNEVDE